MPVYTIREDEPFLSAQDTIIERQSSHTSSEPTFSYFLQTTQHERLRSIARTMIQLLLCSLLVANLVVLGLVFNSTTTAQNTMIQQLPSNGNLNSAAVLFGLDMKTLNTRYGSEVSYMTLDPAYDWLWALDGKEHAGLVTLNPPNEDGSTRWGAITM